MASACRKPDILIFDADIAHRWSVFRRDFKHYVTIAHPAVAPAVKASLLLNLAGPEALERSESFIYGVNENAQDPVCLLAKFTELCDIPTNCILERFKLFGRRQNPGESVDNFVAALRHLARRCSLDALTPETLTRDILVFGLRDEKLRSEFLCKPDLTFNEAHCMPLAWQRLSPPLCRRLIMRSTRAVSSGHQYSAPQRRRVSPVPGSRPRQCCPNCNSASHRFNVCPALGKTCNFCHKQNHFSAACRSHGKPAQPQQKPSNYLTRADTVSGSHNQQEELPLSNSSSSQSKLSVFSLRNAPALKTDPTVLVTVNGTTFSAKVDTEAAANVMSTSLFKKIRNNEHVTTERSVLRAYVGGVLDPVGKATLHCKVLKVLSAPLFLSAGR